MLTSPWTRFSSSSENQDFVSRCPIVCMLFLLLFMQSQQLEGNVWVRNHWQPSATVYSISEETSIHFCFVPVHGYVYNKPHLNFMQRSRKAVELQMLSSLQHLKGICYGFFKKLDSSRTRHFSWSICYIFVGKHRNNATLRERCVLHVVAC